MRSLRVAARAERAVGDHAWLVGAGGAVLRAAAPESECRECRERGEPNPHRRRLYYFGTNSKPMNGAIGRPCSSL